MNTNKLQHCSQAVCGRRAVHVVRMPHRPTLGSVPATGSGASGTELSTTMKKKIAAQQRDTSLTMTVADLNPPSIGCTIDDPPQVVAVPPQLSQPPESNGKTTPGPALPWAVQNGNVPVPSVGGPNGVSPQLPVQAQKLLEGFLSTTVNGLSGSRNAREGRHSGRETAPVGSTKATALEATMQRQARELKEAQMQLLRRDEEVRLLKSQLAERDARLRTARADVLEARAAAAEQRTKLMEAYRMLANAGADKSQLREELAKTRMDLAETRRELEALADEILAVKDIVLNDEELSTLHASLSAAQEENEDCTTFGSGSETSVDDDRMQPYFLAGTTVQDTFDVLCSLSELSRQMLGDARLDEQVFSEIGWFSSGTSNSSSSHSSVKGGARRPEG